MKYTPQKKVVGIERVKAKIDQYKSHLGKRVANSFIEDWRFI